MMVVSVPEPAISGKAIGTTEPLLGSASDLKNSIPNTISKPRMKITIEPPTAKELTSSPRMFKKPSPANTNNIISRPEISVAENSRIPPIFSFKAINKGTEPIISITANKVKVTVNKSSIPQFMFFRRKVRIYCPQTLLNLNSALFSTLAKFFAMKNTLCFLILMLSLFAANGQDKADSAEVLTTVHVKAFHYDRNYLRTPAALAVVGNADLQRFDNTSLVPVINTFPGITMEERSLGSYRINIRGSSLRSPFG